MRNNLMAILAAAGLMFSSAGAAADAARTSSSMEGHETLAANPWIPWVFALAALVAILVVVTDDEDEPASP